MTITDCLGFALGCVGLSLDDFCGLTQEEFESVSSNYTSQRDFFVRNGWERMRQHAAISIQPHLRKKISARQLLPFSWDKETGKKKDEEGENKYERKKQGKDAAKKRFLEIVRRSS